jgi:hypothetical protein
MSNNTIQELLEQKNTLCEIASVLYGDNYILQDEFWNSPTEQEIKSVWEQLDLLGYQEEVTPEMQALGDLLFEDLVKRGIINLDDDDDDRF